MQIGIGLPTTIPGVDVPDILEWARRADEGPFSSLGTIDRLVYSNYEPLITLIDRDPGSFRATAPDWTPTLPAARPGRFGLADLLMVTMEVA